MISGIRRDTDDTQEDGSLVAVNTRWYIEGEMRRRLGMTRLLYCGADSLYSFRSVESGPYAMSVTPEGTLEAISMTGQAGVIGKAYSPPVTTVGDVVTISPPVTQPVVTKPAASQLEPQTFNVVHDAGGNAVVVIPSVPSGNREIYYVSGSILLSSDVKAYVAWQYSLTMGVQVYANGVWTKVHPVFISYNASIERDAIRNATGRVYKFSIPSTQDVKVRFQSPGNIGGVGYITLGIR